MAPAAFHPPWSSIEASRRSEAWEAGAWWDQMMQTWCQWHTPRTVELVALAAW